MKSKASKTLALLIALAMLMSLAPSGLAVGQAAAQHTVVFGQHHQQGLAVTARTTGAAVNVDLVSGQAVANGTQVVFTSVIPTPPPGTHFQWFVNNAPHGGVGARSITLTITGHTTVVLQHSHIGGGGHPTGHWVTISNVSGSQSVPINASRTLSAVISVTQAGWNTNFTHLNYVWERVGGYGTANWVVSRSGSFTREQMGTSRTVTLHLPANLTHSQRGGQWRLHVTLQGGTVTGQSDVSHPITVTITGHQGGYGGGGWWDPDTDTWHPGHSGGGWWDPITGTWQPGWWWGSNVTGGGGGTTIIGGRTQAEREADRDAPPADFAPGQDLPIWTGGHPTLAVAGMPAMRLTIGVAAFIQWGIPVANDVAPFIDPATNRAMVPLRVIAESLDAEVRWQGATRTVFISRGGVEINLQIDVPLPGDMGTPVIVNDRTFVPLRYVSDVMGARVRWDEVARAVYIYRDVQ